MPTETLIRPAAYTTVATVNYGAFSPAIGTAGTRSDLSGRYLAFLEAAVFGTHELQASYWRGVHELAHGRGRAFESMEDLIQDLND